MTPKAEIKAKKPKVVQVYKPKKEATEESKSDQSSLITAATPVVVVQSQPISSPPQTQIDTALLESLKRDFKQKESLLE